MFKRDVVCEFLCVESLQHFLSNVEVAGAPGDLRDEETLLCTPRLGEQRDCLFILAEIVAGMGTRKS